MKTLVLAAAAAALAAGAASAHHSQAAFDQTKVVRVAGTVKEFNWQNPHSSFAIEAPGAGGKTAIWYVEMNSPQNLVREGWKRSSIKPGDKITAILNPMRDGKPGGLYIGVQLADGTLLGKTEGRGGDR